MGEHHRRARVLDGCDDLGVSLRAARLDDRADACVESELRAVGEREERVRGERGAAQVVAVLACLLERDAGRRRRGSSGRRRRRSWRGRCAITIAFEVDVLARPARRAGGRPTSRSSGERAVTTSMASRSSTSPSAILDEHAAEHAPVVALARRRRGAPR